MRVALYQHPGLTGVMEAAKEILSSVPGIDLVDLRQPAAGLMSNYLATLPNYKRDLYRNELEAASKAGIDALVAVYHPDHRELCAHEKDYPFRILSVLDIVGESMGLRRSDEYGRLKLLQNVDDIAADRRNLSAFHRLDADATRKVIEAMLDDQPLPMGKGDPRAITRDLQRRKN